MTTTDSDSSSTKFPPWLAREEAIRTLFQLFGFVVERIEILGRQIDVFATKNDVFRIEPEKWAIEITLEYVDAAKGGKDSQKLLLANKQTGCRMMLVSTKGFTAEQLVTLKELGIICRRYEELEAQFLDLNAYARFVQTQKLLGNADSDIGYDPNVYVDPKLHLHRELAKPDSYIDRTAFDWVAELCKGPSGVVGALLGNLGSGKTTVLQYSQSVLADRFLASPSTEPLPVYVPLNRYKHHSGRVDSLLREVFDSAGISNYPATLVKYLAKCGRLVFLFDGLDEVHPVNSVSDILSTVNNILEYLGKDTRAIISSRTHLFSNRNEELAIFGPYERKQLASLAAELQQLLAGHAHSEIAYVQPFSIAQVEDYLRKSTGQDFDAIRNGIASIYGFSEMASTPVLLAMMRRTLPRLLKGAHSFSVAPQVDLYQAYTARWISRDEGRAQLSVTQREKLSRTMAVQLIKRDEASAPWEDIRAMLYSDPSWKDNPIGDKTAEMDVRNSTFLVREGNDLFRFAHRSLMEYFVALDSFDRLVSGELPEAPYSDGHRAFVAMLVAREWGRSGQCPLPRVDLNVDEYGHREYLGILASATTHFRGRQLAVKPVLNVKVVGRRIADMYFYGVDFQGSAISVSEMSNLRFEACSVSGGTKLKVSIVKSLEFQNCNLTGLLLSAPKDCWKSIRALPEQTEILSVTDVVTEEFLAASRWIGHGAEAVIDGKQWKLSMNALRLMSAISRRLAGVGKIMLTSWSKGTDGDHLRNSRPVLLAAGWITEDTSRQPHQLSLSDRGARLLGQLSADPFAAQDEINSVYAKIPFV